MATNNLVATAWTAGQPPTSVELTAELQPQLCLTSADVPVAFPVVALRLDTHTWLCGFGAPGPRNTVHSLLPWPLCLPLYPRTQLFFVVTRADCVVGLDTLYEGLPPAELWRPVSVESLLPQDFVQLTTAVAGARLCDSLTYGQVLDVTLDTLSGSETSDDELEDAISVALSLAEPVEAKQVRPTKRAVKRGVCFDAPPLPAAPLHPSEPLRKVSAADEDDAMDLDEDAPPATLCVHEEVYEPRSTSVLSRDVRTTHPVDDTNDEEQEDDEPGDEPQDEEEEDVVGDDDEEDEEANDAESYVSQDVDDVEEEDESSASCSDESTDGGSCK